MWQVHKGSFYKHLGLGWWKFGGSFSNVILFKAGKFLMILEILNFEFLPMVWRGSIIFKVEFHFLNTFVNLFILLFLQISHNELGMQTLVI